MCIFANFNPHDNTQVLKYSRLDLGEPVKRKTQSRRRIGVELLLFSSLEIPEREALLKSLNPQIRLRL